MHIPNNRRSPNRLRHAPTILAVIAIVTICTTLLSVFQIFPHAFDKSGSKDGKVDGKLTEQQELDRQKEKDEALQKMKDMEVKLKKEKEEADRLAKEREEKLEEEAKRKRLEEQDKAAEKRLAEEKKQEEEKRKQEEEEKAKEKEDEGHHNHHDHEEEEAAKKGEENHKEDEEEKKEGEASKNEIATIDGKAWARTDEAFVLLLTNDGPMNLIWALEGSLRDVKSTRRRIVLCTPAVTAGAKDTLRKIGMEVREIPQPRHPNFKTQFDHWADTLAKLAIFELEGIRQFVYLDADTMVNHNIDELFQRNTTKMVYGMRDVIDCSNGNPHLNAGLLISRPNITLKNELFKLLEDKNFFKLRKGDQEMLDVYLIRNGMLTLEPETTMSFLVRCHCLERGQIEKYSLDDLKIVHFTKWFIDPKGLLARGATERGNCGNRWYIRWIDMHHSMTDWWNKHYDTKPTL